MINKRKEQLHRTIVIYKPPSFSENTYKTYSTLIAFDVVPDYAPLLAATFDKQMAELGTVREVIAIGFGDYGSDPDDRARLMTPVEGLGVECINGNFTNRCDNCIPDGITPMEQLQYMTTTCGRLYKSGGEGNATLDFLVHTALPRAQLATMNRMLIDQPNLGIVGYSLGGLMTCHAAWTRPTVFGVAACQSASLWWPSEGNFTNTQFFFKNVSMKDRSLRMNRPHQSIYLDVGGAEAGTPFGMIQAMMAVAMDMDTLPSFQLNRNLWTHVFPGENHTLLQWITRLWLPLRTLYPAHPPPDINDTTPPQGNQRDTNGCPGNRLHVSQTVLFCIVLITSIGLL